MKIAELFIALGFKVEGSDQVDKVDQKLNKAEISALGLLAGVTALNAAFYAFMQRGVQAAIGLDRFARSSNVALGALQRMQAAGARSNVAASAIAEGLRLIERTRAEISLGNVDASSPWFLLGVDPRQDPVKVVNDLREALARLDPVLQRTLATRMGFSDEFLYFLQQKKTIGSLFVSPQDVARLTALGGAWRAFSFDLSVVATKFASVFSEWLMRIVGNLEKAVKLLSRFVDWLNSSSLAAGAVRSVLYAVVLLLGLLGIGLTGVVSLLAVLKGLLIAIQLIPIVAFGTAVAAVLALMAGALIGIILLIQDFWTQVEGGKSLFDWNQNLILTVKNVDRLARSIRSLIDLWDGLKSNSDFARIFSKSLNSEAALYASGAGFVRDFANWNWRKGGGGGGSVTNHTSVEINVDGAQDPVATGREVGWSVRREVSDAMGAMPIPVN